MKPVLKATGTLLFTLRYDDPLSSFGFKFNLRRYNKASITLDRIGTYGVSAQLGVVTLCLPLNATTLLTTVYTEQQASVCILPADVVAAAADVGTSLLQGSGTAASTVRCCRLTVSTREMEAPETKRLKRKCDELLTILLSHSTCVTTPRRETTSRCEWCRWMPSATSLPRSGLALPATPSTLRASRPLVTTSLLARWCSWTSL